MHRLHPYHVPAAQLSLQAKLYFNSIIQCIACERAFNTAACSTRRYSLNKPICKWSYQAYANYHLSTKSTCSSWDAAREAWSVPWKSPTIRTTMPTPSSQYDGAHLKCFGRFLVGVERMLVKTLLELHDVFSMRRMTSMKALSFCPVGSGRFQLSSKALPI